MSGAGGAQSPTLSRGDSAACLTSIEDGAVHGGKSRWTRVARAWRSLRSAVATGLRRVVERSPAAVPLSPTTRNAVNTQQAHARESTPLATLALAAHVRRQDACAETSDNGPVLVLVVDAAVPVRMRVYGPGVPAVTALLAAGLRQRVVVPLGSEFRAPDQRRVVLRPHTPGGLEARVAAQRVLLAQDARAAAPGRAVQRHLDVLEIYGQHAPAHEPGPSVHAQDDAHGDTDQPAESDMALAADEPDTDACDERRASDDEDAPECVICLCGERDTLLLPCRHMCICAQCAETLGRGDGKCPLCRQPYASMVTVGP